MIGRAGTERQGEGVNKWQGDKIRVTGDRVEAQQGSKKAGKTL